MEKYIVVLSKVNRLHYAYPALADSDMPCILIRDGYLEQSTFRRDELMSLVETGHAIAQGEATLKFEIKFNWDKS